MEKIINELNVALANMNAQAQKFAVKSAELDSLIVDEKKKLADLDARDEFILGKEALYAQYEAIDVIRAEIKADRIAISKDRSEIAVKKAELDEGLSSVASDRVELDKMLTLYKQKLANCDAKIKELAEDKKNLEKKIIEELTKKLASK